MKQDASGNIPSYIFLGLVTAGFIVLLFSFFFPVFWAAVIAGIFQPVDRYLRRRCNPGLAAALVILVIAAVVILPLGLIGGLLLAESIAILKSLEGGQIQYDKNILAFLGMVEETLLFSKSGISEAFLQDRLS